jgi:hypothetical protein
LKSKNFISKFKSKLIVVFVLNAKHNTVFYVVDENKKTILDFFTINEIINHFGKNNTYWLHILGSGTLTRNIENQYGYLDTVTANGNIADFYFSTYSINDSVIISFIRKALIEPFIDEIEDQKIQLLNISIGTIPLFIHKDLNFQFEYKILIEDTQLIKFDKNEEFIYEMSLAENKKQLLLFDESIKTFFSTDNESLEFAFENEKYLNYKNEFKAKNRFNLIGIGFLTFMTLLILFNAFFSNYLKTEIETKEINIEIINDKIKTIDQLKVEKIRKIELLKYAGINYSNFLSFYIDEIFLTIPNDITLNSFNLFPVKSEIKNEVKIEFANHTILINGSVTKSEILDFWIKSLKQLNWISKIQVDNFIKTNASNNNFTILITIKK